MPFGQEMDLASETAGSKVWTGLRGQAKNQTDKY